MEDRQTNSRNCIYSNVIQIEMGKIHLGERIRTIRVSYVVVLRCWVRIFNYYNNPKIIYFYKKVKQIYTQNKNEIFYRYLT